LQVNPNWPITVWIGLIGTPIMIATGQVLFKVVSSRISPGGIRSLVSVPFDPYFVGAMAIYFAATVSWIYVLRSVPLGVAYSFTALGFVVLPLVSRLIFGEIITTQYCIGTFFIVVGILVAHSP
jgi:drug/metabolite transporter (DMT)-like permease